MCCQGEFGSCCCFTPGEMGESSCPIACACLEAWLCPGPAVSSTSMVMRRQYNLGIVSYFSLSYWPQSPIPLFLFLRWCDVFLWLYHRMTVTFVLFRRTIASLHLQYSLNASVCVLTGMVKTHVSEPLTLHQIYYFVAWVLVWLHKPTMKLITVKIRMLLPVWRWLVRLHASLPVVVTQFIQQVVDDL